MATEHRGLAVYKEDGSDWTDYEILRVTAYAEEGRDFKRSELHNPDVKHTTAEEAKYLYDDGDDDGFMHTWTYQTQAYIDRCTKISYEELFGERTNVPLKRFKMA